MIISKNSFFKKIVTIHNNPLKYLLQSKKFTSNAILSLILHHRRKTEIEISNFIRNNKKGPRATEPIVARSSHHRVNKSSIPLGKIVLMDVRFRVLVVYLQQVTKILQKRARLASRIWDISTQEASTLQPQCFTMSIHRKALIQGLRMSLKKVISMRLRYAKKNLRQKQEKSNSHTIQLIPIWRRLRIELLHRQFKINLSQGKNRIRFLLLISRFWTRSKNWLNKKIKIILTWK